MSEVFDDLVEIQDGSGNTTVTIDGAAGSIKAGDNGESGTITAADAGGLTTVQLNGEFGSIRAGGGGQDGSVTVRDPDEIARVTIIGPTAGAGGIYMTNNDQDVGINLLDVGRIAVRQSINSVMQEVFQVDAGGTTTLTLGAETRPGKATLRDDQGNDTIVLDADERDLRILNEAGDTLFQFKGDTARLRIGNLGHEGDLTVRDGDGRNVLAFNGSHASLKVGAEGGGNEGDVRVYDDAGDVSIHLDGATGVVTSTGADCAEHFTVRDADLVVPGTVLVIDESDPGAGALRQSARAYDRRVAGVVSGAGQYRPGFVLNTRPVRPDGHHEDPGDGSTDRKPVALVGKVCCKVDADQGAIAVGDLLTTADTPGHAMKAADPKRAFGAVIGKALAPLEEGQGLIPILVALQ